MFDLYLACLKRPSWLLAVMAALLAGSAFYWGDLRFDASSETLVVEGDEAFAAYSDMAKRFPTDDFVLLTYTPRSADVFSPERLDQLAQLQSGAAEIDGVSATLSVLDLPLLYLDGNPTLRHKGIDLNLARSYFRDHSLFVNQLISADGRSLAVKVDLTAAGTDAREATLLAIRQLRQRYADDATIQIGGVPLIGSDMIRFVRQDVAWFSFAAVILIGLALVFFFRRPRWVLLCLLNCAAAISLEIGLLGLLDIPISVVSANFVSILAIVAISFTIHLVVRYRELLHADIDSDHREIVLETMRSKFAPCAYTALTTVVAFGSLLTSGIPPVEDFGWMMSVGVVIALFVTYTVFPALLLVLPKGKASSTLGQPLPLTKVLGRWAVHRPGTVGACALTIALVCAVGVSQLSLDSHFSQYFKPSSDIRQGLEFIDAHFGGVLPLDIVLAVDPFEEMVVDEEDDFFMEESSGYQQSSWFSGPKISMVGELSAYLRQRDDVGSVASIDGLAELGATTMGVDRLDDTQLALLVAGMGEDGRRQLVRPYAHPERGELRLSMRMRESTPPAEYVSVVAEIRDEIETTHGLSGDQVQITGMFILFGQSIRTLFDSQLRTIVFVVVATLLMFIVLLRSVPYATIGVATNCLAATTVLAYMGFTTIPLDMMTITIAAISIGIGVDDAIHYLHRYQEERRLGRTALQAVLACHRSIGRAIYFTSVTVIVGFSVLAVSNFIPTIYFGVLTAVAMATALVANLLLLPSLLVLWERLVKT